MSCRTHGTIEELEAALAAVRERGLALEDLRREDFPLPGLAPRVTDWARELSAGRGFLLLRGLPVERWGDEAAAWIYWGLGQHLGTPGAQNPAGELLGHVADTGEEFGETRLLETLQTHVEKPVPELLGAVVDTVRRFSGSEQEDDLTLMLARGRAG